MNIIPSRPLGRHSRAILASILLLLCVQVLPAVAEDDGAYPGWVFSGGVFDTEDLFLAELGLEFRFKPFKLFGSVELKPMVGVSANEEGGAWLYAGLRYDWRVGERWYVTPSFATSLYEEGDGPDLGHVVEFRSSLEVTYRLRNGSRVGAAFYHLSNASLDERNPGANSFVLVWSLGR